MHRVRVPMRVASGRLSLSRTACFALLVGAAASAVGGTVQAEEKTESVAAATGGQLSQSADKEKGVSGYRAGSFVFNPAIDLTEYYDDNIFATRTGEQSDFITVLTPSLTLDSDWDKHKLRLDTGANLGRYAGHSAENYDDYWAGADGRFDITPKSNLFGGGRYSRSHEERESPDDLVGLEPTEYDVANGYAGGFHRFDKLSIRLGGTYRRFDFEDTPVLGGNINNDDRDRNMYTGGANVAYNFGSGLRGFVESAVDLRRYNSSVDDNGFNRDSDGYRLSAGVRFNRNNLKGRVFAGYINQQYDDPALSDISTPNVGGNINWTISPHTKASAFVTRSVDETTLSGASASLSTGGGVNLDHELSPKLTGNLNASFYDFDYRGIDRDDNLLSVGAGLRYQLTPHVYLSPTYRFNHRMSNIESAEYYNNIFAVSLGAQLAEAKPGKRAFRGMSAGAGSEAPFSGFYTGFQVGMGGITTENSGARGGGGNLVAERGDRGADFGLFGGYGRNLKGLYLGVELEAEASGIGIDQLRNPNGRFIAVEKRGALGASARVGYVLKDRALFYARVGGVYTAFDTAYTFGGQSIVQDDKLTGVRYGGGVEVPATGGLSVRLDATQTRYGDININCCASNDTFDAPIETLFRYGLVYRPSVGRVAENSAAKPAEFSGFYVGAQGGGGEFGSDIAGRRGVGGANEGDLNAEFADLSAGGGLFAGYGYTFNRWYLGAELEGNYNGGEWDHSRFPDGRFFSVRKRESYGASARIGYALMGQVLVYGRVGAVRTNFETDHLNLGVDTEQSNDLTGIRFGGGIEVPAADHFVIRMDSTYTTYQDYKVAGVDDYGNSETLFRIGFAYRH